MALAVLDRAMQAHGAEGICQDTMLAAAWAGLRTLRYADGPDEVHMQQQGKIELRRAPALWERQKQLEARRDQLFKQYGTPRAHI